MGDTRRDFTEAFRRGDIEGIKQILTARLPGQDETEVLRQALEAMTRFAVELRRQNVATIGDHDVFVRRTAAGDLRQVIAPVTLSLHDNTLYRIPVRYRKYLAGTDTWFDKKKHRGQRYDLRPVYEDEFQAKLTYEGYMRLNAGAGCSVAQPPHITVDGKQRENPYVERDDDGDLRRIVIGVYVAGPAPLTGNVVVVQYTLDLDPRSDLHRMLANIMKDQAWKNRENGEGAIDPETAGVGTPVRLLHRNDWKEWRAQQTNPYNWTWTPFYGGVGYAHDMTHPEVAAAYDKYIEILKHLFRKAQTVARRNAMKSHPALAVQTVRINDKGEARVRAIGWTTGDSDIDRYRRVLDSVAQGRHGDDIEIIEAAETYTPDEHDTGDDLDSRLEPEPPEEAPEGEAVDERRNELLEQLDHAVVVLGNAQIRALGYPLPDDLTADDVEEVVGIAEAMGQNLAGDHQWQDGPDGAGYHCARCSISKTADHDAHTCESWLMARGRELQTLWSLRRATANRQAELDGGEE